MDPFLTELSSRVGAWLGGDGPDSDVVVSTRIRLARNVRGYPFAPRMGDEQAEELCQWVRSRLRQAPATRGLTYLSLKSTGEVLRETLIERFLVSKELASGRQERGVAFDADELQSVMIHEEDHLRLQSLRSGFDLEGAFTGMLEMDRGLEACLEYAYSTELGYLTSCPTNVGTGLRVSVMLHLPGLTMVQRELKKVFNVASRLHLAVRGLHGEGSQAIGAFFQVSNQITLGRTERELLEDLSDVIPQIVDFERSVRAKVLEARGDELRARVKMARILLLEGRPMALEHAVGALSTLLLGHSCGLEKEPSRAELLRLLVWIYPGHLQSRAGRRLGAPELDVERGLLLQRGLAGEGRTAPEAT